MSRPPTKRILLKLSGEVLMGNQQIGIDPTSSPELAKEAGDKDTLASKRVWRSSGGNIFCGMAGRPGMDRAQADWLGCRVR